jgi:hypothetical protein
MAKGSVSTDLFQQTRIPAVDGRVRRLGVALQGDEWAHLDAIAAELGVTRHSLMQYAIRRLIADHDMGKLSVPTRAREAKVIEMP